jgi:chemotaxis protein CheX
MKKTPANQSHKIELPEMLDLRAATPLAAQLLMRRGEDVILDASAVQRLGGQCLQILLSAKATWEADGAQLRIVDSSPDFVEGLELLGIQSKQLLEEENAA